MPSSKDYLTFVLDQLSPVGDVAYKAMMGEYILYVRGRIVGGIYDDRLLVKNRPSVRALMPDAPLETPYPGAKEMILVDRVDDSAFLCDLMEEIVRDRPAPKRKRT